MAGNDLGLIVAEYWRAIPERFPGANVDTMVVMPNHFHQGIVVIGDRFVRVESPRPGTRPWMQTTARETPAVTLGQIMAWFKYNTTRRINEAAGSPGLRGGRRTDYDHIVRNAAELAGIREYIADNPINWENDQENTGFVQSTESDS